MALTLRVRIPGSTAARSPQPAAHVPVRTMWSHPTEPVSEPRKVARAITAPVAAARPRWARPSVSREASPGASEPPAAAAPMPGDTRTVPRAIATTVPTATRSPWKGSSAERWKRSVSAAMRRRVRPSASLTSQVSGQGTARGNPSRRSVVAGPHPVAATESWPSAQRDVAPVRATIDP
jgi:hypothetical protein